MPSTVIQINQAEVRFGPIPVPPLPLDPALLIDYSCQVTSASIGAASNTTTTTVPATFCQPASEANVPVASTFTLDLDFLQDWTAADGLSEWLFANDATEQSFALYLQGAEDPVASGNIIVQAGAFGGAAGEPLTATVSLNIQGYPNIIGAGGTPIRPVALAAGATATPTKASKKETVDA